MKGKNINHELFKLNITSLSEEQTDIYLSMLIDSLPNDGKLYKYRSILKPGYDYVLESIRDGYIWVADVESLNDRKDSSIIVDREKDADELEAFFEGNKIQILRRILERMMPNQKHIFDNFNDVEFEKLVRISESGTDEMKEEALKRGATVAELSQFDMIDPFLNEAAIIFEKYGKPSQEQIDNAYDFNNKVRNNLKVFSLSDSFDYDHMWAYYGNNNKGFCIEYDVKKVLKMDLDVKKKFLCFYKVYYSDCKDPMSFAPIFKDALWPEGNSPSREKVAIELMSRLLVKETKWEKEGEWRLLMYSDVNKLSVDIVSKIVYDESLIGDEGLNKLIDVCKNKNIDLVVRRYQKEKMSYSYEKAAN